MSDVQRYSQLVPFSAPPVLVTQGDEISASKMNRNARAIQQAAPLLQAPTQVDRGNNPFIARYVELLKLLSDGDNMLCRSFGEAGTTSVMLVARPTILRRSFSNGKTLYTGSAGDISYEWTGDQTRTATNADDETETQEITENYVEAFGTDGRTVVRQGSLLIVGTNISGGTGAIIRNKGVIEQVVWVDLNDSGRMWAAVLD